MLKEKIKKDLTASLKSGDQFRRVVLSTLWSEIKSKELNKRLQLSKTLHDYQSLEKQSQLEDQEVLEVVVSEVKKCQDSSEQFRIGGREDLAQKEEKEWKILKIYLHPPASEEEIEEEIRIAMATLATKDQKAVGQVVGAVMARLKGRVDGKLVSQLIKKALAA